VVYISDLSAARLYDVGLERIWKEAAMVYSSCYPCIYVEGPRENHENPQSGYPVQERYFWSSLFGHRMLCQQFCDVP
jgi:hypothetical protein